MYFYLKNFEDVLLWCALENIQNGKYIDIGAHHPIIDSVSLVFYEHGWRGIHIFGLINDGIVHWLKIDVEGHERQVLEGRSVAVLPWVAVVDSTYSCTQIDTNQAWEELLIAKGYLFAHNDGLNRYYISPEHPEIVPSLQYGTNVFDGFQLADHHWAVTAQRQQLEAKCASTGPRRSAQATSRCSTSGPASSRRATGRAAASHGGQVCRRSDGDNFTWAGSGEVFRGPQVCLPEWEDTTTAIVTCLVETSKDSGATVTVRPNLGSSL